MEEVGEEGGRREGRRGKGEREVEVEKEKVQGKHPPVKPMHRVDRALLVVAAVEHHGLRVELSRQAATQPPPPPAPPLSYSPAKALTTHPRSLPPLFKRWKSGEASPGGKRKAAA